MIKIKNSKKFKTLGFKILNLFRISNFEFRILSIVLVTGYSLLVTVSVALAVSPLVLYVSPSDGSTNVPQRPTITAYFNKDINPVTVNNDTFKLKNKSGTKIKGNVSYSLSEKKASFEPDGLLPYDNKYIVTITTGVIDLAGNHLASDYVWSFYTTKGTDLPIAYPGCSRPVWEYVTCPSGEVVCPDIGCPEKEEKPTEKTEIPTEPPSVKTTEFPKSGIKSIVPCGTEKYPPGTKKMINGTSTDVGGQISNPCTICHLFVGVNNIIRFLTFDIATPLGVIVLIYGGVMILTSGGSEEKLKKGKQALWFTLWGLVIVFASFLIIATIMGNLVKPGFLPWQSFPGC